MEIFKYLGRIATNNDCDTPAIRRNLRRARTRRGRLQKAIAQKAVPVQVAGMFYQAVVAAVLLYGINTWCLSATARRQLDGFDAGRRAG